MRDSAEERQNSARARDYLKAHSIKKDLPQKPSKEDIERIRAKRMIIKPPVPKAKDIEKAPEKKQKNFITENAVRNIHSHPPATPPGSPPRPVVDHIHAPGKVPK